ncbi:Breast cancer type 1 susceptibility -like protein [Sarcoptes scabiei]|uniref:Breast cancer type 1 susceptibility -like protein n=1 Tax=Sarcoptes scabiei TaxID=52283 RepID=A0A834R797_SARSC|nr:Breast cancer type 1 susceptibility -like protein [Sarcoptes scabiei]
MNSFRSKDKNTVLNKILNELNRSVSCPKCRKQSTEIDYIGLDCGHIFCSNCSYKFSKCPSCSKESSVECATQTDPQNSFKEFASIEIQTDFRQKDTRSIDTQTDFIESKSKDNSNLIKERNSCCLEKNLRKILDLNICNSLNLIIQGLLENENECVCIVPTNNEPQTNHSLSIQNHPISEDIDVLKQDQQSVAISNVSGLNENQFCDVAKVSSILPEIVPESQSPTPKSPIPIRNVTNFESAYSSKSNDSNTLLKRRSSFRKIILDDNQNENDVIFAKSLKIDQSPENKVEFLESDSKRKEDLKQQTNLPKNIQKFETDIKHEKLPCVKSPIEVHKIFDYEIVANSTKIDSINNTKDLINAVKHNDECSSESESIKTKSTDDKKRKSTRRSKIKEQTLPTIDLFEEPSNLKIKRSTPYRKTSNRTRKIKTNVLELDVNEETPSMGPPQPSLPLPSAKSSTTPTLNSIVDDEKEKTINQESKIKTEEEKNVQTSDTELKSKKASRSRTINKNNKSDKSKNLNEPEEEKIFDQKQSKDEKGIEIKTTISKSVKEKRKNFGDIEETSIDSKRARSSSTDTENIVVMCSGLDATQKNKLKKASTQLNFELIDKWTPRITHLVVALAKNTPKKDLLATRSVKYLMCLLGGKWIVSFDWITASLNSGKLVDESRFEIRGTRNCQEMDRPNWSRKTKIDFFKNYAIQFVGEFDNLPASRADFECLVEIGKGVLVHEDDDLSKRDDSFKYIVVTDNVTLHTQDSIKFVTFSTFLDSITNLQKL